MSFRSTLVDVVTVVPPVAAVLATGAIKIGGRHTSCIDGIGLP